ncbi:MAG TPA: copper-binding protein [Thermoanaerobaculia bacterium]
MRSALKWSLTLGALAILLTLGCARKERGHNYIVRGQVVALPSPANGNLLELHHEAVDGFVTRDGKVEGMDSMTMPFLVARNVPLRDIQPGDKIEVILHVDWQADRAVEITGLRKLAPDQKLDFRAAHPPGKP